MPKKRENETERTSLQTWEAREILQKIDRDQLDGPSLQNPKLTKADVYDSCFRRIHGKTPDALVSGFVTRDIAVEFEAYAKKAFDANSEVAAILQAHRRVTKIQTESESLSQQQGSCP